MGSWANSLHVRHTDPQAVVRAIRALSLAQGFEVDVGQYKPVKAAAESATPFAQDDTVDDLAGKPLEDWTEEDFRRDDEEFEKALENYDEHATEPIPPVEEGPQHRRLVVYQPVEGWVGVLEKEGLGSDLGQHLSVVLKADALSLYVNDSDSWGYEILRSGTSRNRFDSMGDPDGEVDTEAMSPELEAAIARGDDDEIERLMNKEFFFKNSPQGPIVFPDGRMAMPPEMAILKGRMREGKATLGERLRYFWLWIKFQARRFWGWLVPSSLQFGFDVPPTKPLDRETLQKHLDALKEIFPAADEKALAALLPQSRFPSEDLLREFLEIVGLPSLYAFLSYEYRSDFGKKELARQGIVEVAKFRFVKPG